MPRQRSVDLWTAERDLKAEGVRIRSRLVARHNDESAQHRNVLRAGALSVPRIAQANFAFGGLSSEVNRHAD